MIVEVDKELEAVFPRYLRNREEDILKIQSALDRKDFESLRQIGHKLAGSAPGYGLSGLGDMAKLLELAAVDRQNDKCRHVAGQMKAYLAALQLKFV